jgi:DNA-directed RNA polymerase subunit RPC12/RpoP
MSAKINSMNESENENEYKPHLHIEYTDMDVPVNYVCKICNKPGHWLIDCIRYECKKCGLRGHLMKDCPAISPVPHSIKNSFNQIQVPLQVACQLCGETGHSAIGCVEYILLLEFYKKHHNHSK